MHVRSGPTMAHVLAADAKLARATKNCKEESSDVGMVASTATEGEISVRNARLSSEGGHTGAR